MTWQEIKTATEMLKDRCDRLYSRTTTFDGDLCLTAHWIDGGQKIFHTLGDVEANCDEYASRQTA
jgi:hypothetical protein